MKKLLFFLLLLPLGMYAQTVINVHNGDNLQALIDANPAGSVFYLHAGSYGNLTLTKKVTIFGGGYFLTPENAVSPAHAVVGRIIFQDGSERSMISGFQCSNVWIHTNYVVTANMNTGGIYIGYNGSSSYINGDFVVVKKCIVGSIYHYSGNDFVIRNNLIKSIYQVSHNGGTGVGIIENNSFDSDMDGNSTSLPWNINCTVKNNIFRRLNTNQSVSNQLNFRNNVWGGTSIVDYHSSNKDNIDINSLYVGYPTNSDNLPPDARNQLAPNSPARGAGENGTDCGAFGGDDPYVLSGIPDIPSIYQLTVPSQVPQNGTLNVQIKAKTNN